MPVGIVQFASLARGFIEAISDKAPTLETIRAAKHYDWAFKDTQTGIQVHLAEAIHVQGFQLVASGKACEWLKPTAKIARIIEIFKLKVTRFDFALDVIYGGWTPGDVYDAYITEHGKDRQKKVVYINRKDNHGVEFGSRTSERFLRVYDKGREQRIPIDWQRIEMEYKKGYAHYAFETFNDYPLSLCGDVQKFIRVPDCPASKALGDVSLGAMAERYKRPIAVPDKEKWLRGTVLQSFAKMCMDDENGAARVFSDFHETLIAARFAKAIGVSLDTIPRKGIQSQK